MSTGFENQKKQRLDEIQKYIKKESPKYDQAIAEIQIEYGLSEDKAHEYLDLLMKGDKIKLKDNDHLEG